jgi:ribonuclease BN (tRNA processing enzyme)
MKITFKNVGQGDSIILEWLKNGEPRLGIVDCNLYQKTNPTIQHLQQVGCTKIDFIILSHPHEDHFSGMLELLEYCEVHNIPITTFGHTGAALHPRYLRYANIRESDQVLLDKIIIKAKSLYNKKLIRLLGAVNQNMAITLNQDFTLKALSPSLIEFEKFTKEIDFYNDTDFTKCSKAANYLSSVLKIYSKKEACLLTSDAEKTLLKDSINAI